MRRRRLLISRRIEHQEGTEGTAGTSPFGMLTGKPDIQEQMLKNPFTGELASTGVVTGTEVISLADIATEPGIALSTMAMNFQKNLLLIIVHLIYLA